MKLTQEQINYLFSFCAEQGIYYYDVQQEMVDHFTEWIETNWQKQPYASFLFMVSLLKQAFMKEELKTIEKEKRKNLKNEMLRHYKNELISFFTIPKIALSLLLFAIFFAIPLEPESNKIWFFISLPIYILNTYTGLYYLIAGKNIVKKNKEQRMRLLLVYNSLEWLLNARLIVGSIFIIAVISLFFTNIKIENLLIINLIRLLIPVILITFFSLVHVAVQMNKKIRELYPAAFI